MAERKKIILLEDDRTTSRLISDFLEVKGFDVQESREGRLAIEQALRQKPDLMIVDVLLPDMHGSDAVKQIRTANAMHDLKVIFITSLLSKGAKRGEMQITVAGKEYPALAKPFNPELMGSLIDRLLGGKN